MEFLVTIEAILEYLEKAKQAQDKLEEANSRMERASEAVLQQWQGDAANAFAAEQQQVHGFVRDVIRVGANFIQIVKQAVEKYLEAERIAKESIQQG